MALIDKETIRAEIERLIEMNKTKRGFPAGTYCAIRIDTYEHLLNFIDFLPEQPAEGLEEEMEKFFETMPVLEHENIFEDTFQNIARHFAEWGIEEGERQMIENARA